MSYRCCFQVLCQLGRLRVLISRHYQQRRNHLRPFEVAKQMLGGARACYCDDWCRLVKNYSVDPDVALIEALWGFATRHFDFLRS